MGQSKLFLPFTPQGADTELIAIDVKAALGLRADVAVDPFEMLPEVPARLLNATEIAQTLPPLARKALFESFADSWSGVGFGRMNGEDLILLNPTHHLNRQRATLMEEIVHIILDHPKVRLQSGADGVNFRRTYEKAVEDEAYSVGAACIMPYPALFNAVHRAGETSQVIAGRYHVSEEYAWFRIKRAGLARVYAKQQRLRAPRVSSTG